LAAASRRPILSFGLEGAGAGFRGEISAGGAGRAMLHEAPSRNVVELFEFKRD
jgi:hypothetical protein